MKSSPRGSAVAGLAGLVIAGRLLLRPLLKSVARAKSVLDAMIAPAG